MKKKLYFGSNLKMYKNVQDTVAYLKKLSDNTADLSRDEIQLFIIPSFTSLDRATASIDQNSILLGRTKHVLGRSGTVYRRNLSTDVKRTGN